MDIVSPSVTVSAREVRIGDAWSVQHVHLDCTDLRVALPLGSGPIAAVATLRVVVNEAEVNRLLAGRAEGGLRDVSLGLMTGKVRIAGRYEVMGPIAVPFTLVALPEIVGGTHLRLDIQDVSVVGATLPGFSAQMIGEKVNARLAETLNVQKLGVPVRLTGIAVEPGRLVVTADASVAITYPASEVPALAPPRG
jgi:hypothetical protein